MLTIIHTSELDTSARDTVTRVISGELESRGDHFRLHHDKAVSGDELMALRQSLPFDVNPLPEDFQGDRLALVISDMDSTLINIECVDEIADFAGVKPQVSAITEAAMRGELDFAASLTKRVATLAGLDEGVLQRVYDERLQLNPGAEEMLAGLHQHKVSFALVSGGFTFFTERLKQRLGFEYARANLLGIEDGKLTGKVVSDIVDAQAKQDFLLELCESKGISTAQAIAMGDGANDLKMLHSAGLGVAYRAKPKVQEQSDAVFNHSGLDALLHFL